MTQDSENIAGISHDSSAGQTVIDWSIAPWSDFFAALPAVTADNTEMFDAALLLALEQACDGKDTDLTSPVGAGEFPFDGLDSRQVLRSDGGEPAITQMQNRKQLRLAVYTIVQPVNPANAVTNGN